ncbi:MAG: hypothetical protein Fur0023_00950 [Bacteroidia bacterium]
MGIFLLAGTGILSQNDNNFGNKVKEQAKTSSENRSLNEVDKAVNKAFDEVEKGVIGVFKKKDKKQKEEKNKDVVVTDNKSEASSNDVKDNNSKASNSDKKTSYISKFDFVSGEKILVVEDFMQDNIGDFPDKWNTNGSGEVVNVSDETGHWLMLGKKGRYIPEYINNLPENFTYEFDLICNDKFNFYSPYIDIYFLTGKNDNSALSSWAINDDKRSGIKIGFHPHNAGNKGGTIKIETFDNGQSVIKNELETSQFNSLIHDKTKVHVAIWRQKNRVRVYVNEDKVADLPRAFSPDKKYATNFFEIWGDMYVSEDRYFISNIKLAIGAPDTRNKLLTEGKFVTTGILFDVNSDKIKSESYGVLKEIANVLKENPDVRIKIIGHTDSDGDEKANLELSKKRSLSVKNALVKDFSIDEKRIETDGKGESEPVVPNDTPANKAQNRRVEFVKI